MLHSEGRVLPTRADEGDANAAARERIAASSRNCFERYGVRKTTIDDIASDAGISRGSVYRYFANKEDILRYVSAGEITRVNREIRSRLPRVENYQELLTESLLLATVVGRDNKYVRMFVESIEYTAKSADPSTQEYVETSAVWAPLIESAMKKGEFADDLSRGDIASWLILSEALLFTKADSPNVTEDELRRFIRRFVVMPLFNKDRRAG
ncbi:MULTISPECIES: TetR/AcrR family transcriptional regulator [unclassified Sphingomonas]|uniref:TetR/AcrR family transcriptional regulator n=1 Tax=unclassified Sphingomonas TaxID=196159 RepID=UPI001AD333D5|nr:MULTISPECIES: TetR/AcrR family transcriptional regulator [unclassified Sphingomonas]MBN8848618.1 TetR/AcrR family transcriptional regulator [Sphingomonas sp.]